MEVECMYIVGPTGLFLWFGFIFYSFKKALEKEVQSGRRLEMIRSNEALESHH